MQCGWLWLRGLYCRPYNNSKMTPLWKEESVRTQKRECRRAERKWRKSKLHYEIYKEKLCVFNQTLRRTRKSYFSEIIKNCSNNSRVLFATLNRLTNPPVSLHLKVMSLQYSLMTNVALVLEIQFMLLRSRFWGVIKSMVSSEQLTDLLQQHTQKEYIYRISQLQWLEK